MSISFSRASRKADDNRRARFVLEIISLFVMTAVAVGALLSVS